MYKIFHNENYMFRTTCVKMQGLHTPFRCNFNTEWCIRSPLLFYIWGLDITVFSNHQIFEIIQMVQCTLGSLTFFCFCGRVLKNLCTCFEKMKFSFKHIYFSFNTFTSSSIRRMGRRFLRVDSPWLQRFSAHLVPLDPPLLHEAPWVVLHGGWRW